MPKLLFVFHDIGAANIFIESIKKLKERHDILIISEGSSRQLFIRHKIDFKSIKNLQYSIYTDKDVLPIIDSFKPELIITGTSNTSNLEMVFWEVGKYNNITTVSTIDYWTSFAERYSINGGKRVESDFIFVTNKDFKKQLVSEGFVHNKIIFIGNPYIDEASDFKDLFESSDEYIALKNKYDTHGFFTLLFASEFTVNPEPYTTTDRGYTEFDALDEFFNGISTIKQYLEIQERILIKPHPFENNDKYDRVNSYGLCYTVVKDNIDPRKIILISDIVCGMTSVLLFEAALLCKPVFSIQPNLTGPDYSYSNKHNLSILLTKKGEFKDYLYSILTEQREEKIINYNYGNDVSASLVEIIEDLSR